MYSDFIAGMAGEDGPSGTCDSKGQDPRDLQPLRKHLSSCHGGLELTGTIVICTTIAKDRVSLAATFDRACRGIRDRRQRFGKDLQQARRAFLREATDRRRGGNASREREEQDETVKENAPLRSAAAP